MSSKWVSMKQACDILDISLSTLRRRIDKDTIESKYEGRRRLVLVEIATSDDTLNDISMTQTNVSFVEQLKYQIETLQQQLDRREEEVVKLQDELAQSRERSDTIILQLTRQVEQSQRLLEYHSEPWYRKWFRKKQE